MFNNDIIVIKVLSDPIISKILKNYRKYTFYFNEGLFHLHSFHLDFSSVIILLSLQITVMK